MSAQRCDTDAECAEEGSPGYGSDTRVHSGSRSLVLWTALGREWRRSAAVRAEITAGVGIVQYCTPTLGRTDEVALHGFGLGWHRLAHPWVGMPG